MSARKKRLDIRKSSRYIALPASCDRTPLTSSQRQKKREELERERERKGKEGASKPTERAAVVPVQTKDIPATQGSPPDSRDDGDDNVPSGVGSSSWVDASESHPLSTLSPLGAWQGTGRLNPDKTAVNDGYDRGGQSRNSSRGFFHLRILWRLMC